MVLHYSSRNYIYIYIYNDALTCKNMIKYELLGICEIHEV